MTPPIVVVGGGHAGLSVAALLRQSGPVPVEVFERSSDVGASWRARRPGLLLNTDAWGSSLPGLRLKAASRWPSAEEFVSYLEGYQHRFVPRTRFGIEVLSLRRGRVSSWVVETSSGRQEASAVVLATGPDEVPRRPMWLDNSSFPGIKIHSGAYRTSAPFHGREVVVVGGGESGADIAVDLVSGGASRVELSIRSSPFVMRPSVLGISAQRLAVLGEFQSERSFDRSARLLNSLFYRDLARFGITRTASLHQTARINGHAPVLDRGFADAVRSGQIGVKPALCDLTAEGAHFIDGTTSQPDAVIAATGFIDRVAPLLSSIELPELAQRRHSHVWHDPKNAPGLFLTGYSPALAGNIREAAKSARSIVRLVNRHVRSNVLYEY